ncbi:MAG: hypothetical protein DME55_07810 [Verrucomicrobia bacterium]|nr:MAG: hypothetical protein DME55_07810 [Verrucomicrobiota bacterium]
MVQKPKKKSRRPLGKKKVQLTMLPTTHELLDQAATEATTTMSEYVEQILLRHFKARASSITKP